MASGYKGQSSRWAGGPAGKKASVFAAALSRPFGQVTFGQVTFAQASFGLASAMILGASLLWTGPAWAQAATGEAAKARKGEVSRSLQSQQQEPVRVIAPEDVSFQDVLENPSDPAVNLAYARKLIAEGRLEVASATLERILLQYPNLNDVRLLYAIVLYRLDSLDEARSELNLLLSRETTAQIRSEAERYAGQIEQAQQSLHKTATLSLGGHVDTNRNAYPGGGDFLILNTPLQGTGERERDVGWLALGTAEIRYDTGDQQTQELSARVSAIVDNQVKIDPLDLRGAIFEFGMLHKETFADIRPRVRYSYIELSQRKYVADTAAGVNLERRLGVDGLTGMLDAEIGYENFSNTDDIPLASEQQGRYWDVKTGAAYVVDPTMRVSGAVHHRDKKADVRFEAYKTWGIEASVLKVYDNNSYLAVDGSVDFQKYRDFDTFISTNKQRSDRDLTLSVTYGLPLLTVIHLVDEEVTLPAGWDDFDLALSGTYTRQHSNIPNFDYHNLRGQVLLSKRWTF